MTLMRGKMATERIYCGIEKREVIRGKCLHDKKMTVENNPTCPRCHYYLQLYPPRKLEIEDEKRGRPLFPAIDNSKLLRHFKKLTQQYDLKMVFSIADDKDPRDKILYDIEFVLGLHNSFWENPQFRAWQFLRLNKQYRTVCLNRWKPLIEWAKKELPPDEMLKIQDFNDPKIREKWKGKKAEIIDYTTFVVLQKSLYSLIEIYPSPGETFNDWDARASNLQEPLKCIINGINVFLNMTDLLLERIADKSALKRWVLKEYFKTISSVPIYYTVRFPLPFVLRESIPPWPTRVKGNPRLKQNLARNLLVYELSEFFYDKDIKSLLGIHGTRSEWDDKDSSFSHISRIRKTVRKSIEGALTILTT